MKFPALGSIRISMPSYREQSKIAEFFKTLDDTITLHQREYENAKKFKQTMLSKMFPKNGADKPEFRFAGFTDDWEQRKLGDVVNVLKSFSLSREVETKENTGYRYIHYGDIHRKIVDLVTSEDQLPKIREGKYELLRTGDVVVADASEDYIGIAEPAVILAEIRDKVVAGLHTIAMRPTEISSLYLYYLLHTENFKIYGGKVGTGMKVFGITKKNLLKYTSYFPIKEEQAKIGALLYKLDNTITLHQRELESLKNMKKAYLQKMFI